MGTRQEQPEIIVIDDDETAKSGTQCPSDGDDAYDSDANSSGFENCSNGQPYWQSVNGLSAGNSDFPAKFHDDDCFVSDGCPMESGPSRLSWRSHRRAPRAEKRPAMMRNILRSSSSSSDCEIVEDLDGKFRQDWERAALKKRFGSSFVGDSFRAESEESTSAAGIAARRNCSHKGIGPFEESDNKSQKGFYNSGSSRVLSTKDKDSTPVTLLDQQDSNDYVAFSRSEDSLNSEEVSVTGTASTSLEDDQGFQEEGASCSHENSAPIQFGSSESPRSEGAVVPELERRQDVSQEGQAPVEVSPKALSENVFLVEEAQCQRKRRRVDAERKLEMEIRQRQRVEEMRQTQEEEERIYGHKEEIRGRIRLELEGVAASSLDMAALLRNLGVEVDGGLRPSIQQVNAAYKRALLRFHPDRVAASAKSDPLHQVEAEETFKLISKMKSTLQPVVLC